MATNAKSAMSKLQNKNVDQELKRLAYSSDESSEPDDGIQHVEKSFQITMGTAATTGIEKVEMNKEQKEQGRKWTLKASLAFSLQYNKQEN